jgi:hypothetical protein
LAGGVETRKGLGGADWARTELALAEFWVVSDVRRRRIGREQTRAFSPADRK